MFCNIVGVKEVINQETYSLNITEQIWLEDLGGIGVYSQNFQLLY